MPHLGPNEHPDVMEMIKSRALEFPIATKHDFITQMTKSGEPVWFHGVAYDPEFAAGLVPEFFFPITCEQDMLEKAVELITSRGLLPIRRDR
jgi:hypothetical protein